MARKTQPTTCSICDCKGNVLLHNINAINRMRERAVEACTDACPKCGGPANPELLKAWGHCFQCQKAAQSATYGF